MNNLLGALGTVQRLLGQVGLNRFLGDMTDAINEFVRPVFIFIGVIGVFFAIYLAWRLASAEDDSKRKEAKKQLMWTIIAIIALFGFIIVFSILGEALADQFPE